MRNYVMNTTPKTLVGEKQNPSDAKGEEQEAEKSTKHTNVEISTIGHKEKNVSGPQIEGSKETCNKTNNIVLSATVSVSSTEV